MLPEPDAVKVHVRDAVPGDADAVVVLLAKGRPPTGLPEREGAAVAALVDAGLVTGKAGEASVHLLDGRPSRLVVVGVGDASKADAARLAGGTLAKVARQHKLASLAVLAAGEHAAAVAGGFVLGRFSYAEHKGTATDKADRPTPVKLTVVDAADAEAVERAVIVAEAQNFARAIAMRPGNDINPPSLADVAEEMAAEVGLRCQVLDERDLAKLGMGGLLGVGAGSQTPPRLIVLEHGGPGKGKKGGKKKGGGNRPLLVVGKAITFDTGGISIKPAANMQSMVFDKCGGMAVLGLMFALAKLKVPVRVVGILAAAENHISGTAYRPGDILHMYNGVTVEVTNTDAEGRLVLGDALAWGIETYKPSAVVDLATLTGACVVALGTTMAGLMSNSDELVGQLQRAAAAAGEKVWRLPVEDEHRERLKSVPADIVNAPGREGGALTAAAFLSHFVPRDGSVPWAHLDIAGVADTDKPTPIYAKGATGWGVRTLVEWVTAQVGAGAANAEASQDTPPPAGG